MASVLFDCERMKNPNTGLYHFCLNLGVHLLDQKHSSDQVIFYGPSALQGLFGDSGDYTAKKAWQDLPLPFSNGYTLGPPSSKIDIWHMTHQTSRYRPKGKKNVLTIHDLNFLHDHPTEYKNKKYLQIVQDRIDKADHIVCISNYCRDDVMKNLSIHSKPVSVVYNGCNFQKADLLAEPKYRPSKPFILALGTVLPKKNFHVLPSLLQSYEGELIIAGPEQVRYKNKIEEEAKKYKVIERLKFTGSVSENDKNWYYKNCDAFLFPSLAEGFGLPVIEAMSYGKPVFISNRTSLPEIGGPYAYYFSDFDPVKMQETFFNGMNDFQSLKKEQHVRAWAQQFSWDKAATEYWNIYRSLL